MKRYNSSNDVDGDSDIILVETDHDYMVIDNNFLT